MDETPLLTVDPGREKCGLAVVTTHREVLERDIVETPDLVERLARLIAQYGCTTVVLGDRTYARETAALLRDGGIGLEIVFVDEDHSSEEGRERFLRVTPARGWQRLLPLGLRTPNRPYDDFVAIILAERFLDGRRSTRRAPLPPV